MAASYYVHNEEFSSDEDINRIEQQAERLVQSKFDPYAPPRPTKSQIEEAIETIRRVPLEQDVNLSDDLMAGLLDYYKTQRGPIVDSTRNLYKKIILRLVRGEQQQQQQQQANNGDSAKESNGNKQADIANNNDINLISKKLAPVEVASSDDDEPMPPVSSQSSVENNTKNRLEPMDVDIDVPSARPQTVGYRTSNPRQIDLDTESSESDTETSGSEESSVESEMLDVTPIKKPTQTALSVVGQPKTVATVATTAQVAAPTPVKIVSQVKSAVLPRNMAATNVAGDSINAKKKPYTRSQRLAANRMTSTPAKGSKTDVSSSKSDSGIASNVTPLNKSALTSYENCSRSLSKIKLEQTNIKKIIEDENGQIAYGSTINGRKLNYAEKMVLTAMVRQRDKLRLKIRRS